MLALSSQPQPFAIAAHAQLARTSVSALSLTLASSAFAASTSAASAPTASSDVTCSHDHCWHSWKNAARMPAISWQLTSSHASLSPPTPSSSLIGAQDGC